MVFVPLPVTVTPFVEGRRRSDVDRPDVSSTCTISFGVKELNRNVVMLLVAPLIFVIVLGPVRVIPGVFEVTFSIIDTKKRSGRFSLWVVYLGKMISLPDATGVPSALCRQFELSTVPTEMSPGATFCISWSRLHRPPDPTIAREIEAPSFMASLIRSESVSAEVLSSQSDLKRNVLAVRSGLPTVTHLGDRSRYLLLLPMMGDSLTRLFAKSLGSDRLSPNTVEDE